MAKPKTNSKLLAKPPKNFFEKPLQAEFKALFKALAKGIGHTATGKWEELGTVAVESLSAIGLTTEPDELAFLLIRRSLTKAIFELLGDIGGQELAASEIDSDTIVEKLDFSTLFQNVQVDYKFLDRPSSLPLLQDIQPFLEKLLEANGVSKSAALTIASRVPSYFAYALNQEWRRNAKLYRPLLDALSTPFTKAGEREWAWASYAAMLQRRIQESIFDEPFSLSQIYVPLNATYAKEDGHDKTREDSRHLARDRKRVVISLEQELFSWIENSKPADAIRVISGGPGSGKSSFARIFAARLSEQGKIKVLLVPLHLIDPTKGLLEEVGRFVREEGILLENPLSADSPEPSLLIIFDGLDELASQGKVAAETARGFVREVERTVERRNVQKVTLRVLINGRELVVQENESEFRRPRQILTLLPYFFPTGRSHTRDFLRENETLEDQRGLLKIDLRQQWWKRYGELTGQSFSGLPKELNLDGLSEITAQPLLNYLVALSFTRKKLDFDENINLNSIYADLISAVYERGYENHRAFASVRHMKQEDFFRILEEVALAAWHGDGRSTTTGEIEQHCRASGLGVLLDVFQEGAKAGVTRLLAAFFFRQYGQRSSGDATFVFTHKSFGEYLTARRFVRAMERVIRELNSRSVSPDGGWDDREALKHWVQICGPSPMSPYLAGFVSNELRLRDPADLPNWQDRLAKLFGHVLRHGMPMERLQIAPFNLALFHARNAEEALLIALNGCARLTGKVSELGEIENTTFGAWFRRIQGQRNGPESILAAHYLSYLDLSGSVLDIGDYYDANFHRSILRNQAIIT